jgi:hypothetical protein
MKTLVVYNIGTDSEILCIVICNDLAEVARARQSIRDYWKTAPSPEQWPNQDIEDWLAEHGFRVDAEPEQEWLE